MDPIEGFDKSSSVDARDVNDSVAAVDTDLLLCVNQPQVQLKKLLGFRQGFNLMVGSIMGSGIFISPSLVAQETSSVGMLFVTWVVSGLISLIGALCYCELGCIIKSTGGSYASIKFIYGSLPGFLCAVTNAFLADPAGVAIVALSLGVYAAQPFYETESDAEAVAKLIAYISIIVVCIINCLSIRISMFFQSVMVFVQVVGILFVVSLGIWQLFAGNGNNFKHAFNGTRINWGEAPHIGIAVMSALWSYDGWSTAATITEDLANLNRNLFLVTVTSVPFVILCYIATNISFLAVFSRSDIAASSAIGIDFVKKLLGCKTAYVIMALVAVASYGTLNGCLFANPRFTLAAARDGEIPTILALIRKKNRIPVIATITESFLACMMLIPHASQLKFLITVTGVVQWVIYGACILGVVVLRFQMPDIPRPFKVFIGVPILGIFCSAFLIVMPVYKSPTNAIICLGILLGVGILYFIKFICKRFSRARLLIVWHDLAVEKLCICFNLVPCTHAS